MNIVPTAPITGIIPAYILGGNVQIKTDPATFTLAIIRHLGLVLGDVVVLAPSDARWRAGMDNDCGGVRLILACEQSICIR